MAAIDTFRVESHELQGSETLPMSAVHGSAGGANESPALAWSGEPAGTRSFAVTMYDPDAPTTVGFSHWILLNVDSEIHELKAGSGGRGRNPAGTTLGFTDWGGSAYEGAAPPPGDAPHRYVLTVYALDIPELDVDSTTTYALFRFLAREHILAQHSLVRTFGR
ncbi:MAG: YbhB/YbcL family Raf kinase inhibitor-like protein [Dactylosporangium sp.]|nr:YbhB/YbcL family Raf kinase inhibitor-like protein [Dactylosporangium sp.]NNJ62120.1 YbhB/YbcL family Raf kinase inhibitor-like protein [Dactylosporangium sp.]